ncbi:hypothetical protein TCON_0990 [Astathelohania contejeani]|uniref:Uncharacterized protein n=1 Tax=Astathelohania contejeani TaxID=164912 RepID=A0ABQ7I064_9MICR|nr:hypothetical protein TCON_0990 [Thelohania contejeani]
MKEEKLVIKNGLLDSKLIDIEIEIKKQIRKHGIFSKPGVDRLRYIDKYKETIPNNTSRMRKYINMDLMSDELLKFYVDGSIKDELISHEIIYDISDESKENDDESEEIETDYNKNYFNEDDESDELVDEENCL